MLRRTYCLHVIGLALTLLLVGCDQSGSSTTSGGGGGGAPDSSKPKVGVSIPAADRGWTAGVGWWAEKAIAQHGDIDWSLQRARDAEEQVNQVQALLETGIGVLVILPHNADTQPAVEAAKRRGVFVIIIDRGLRDPIGDIYLTGDNAEFGKVAAQYMVDRLEGTGKIVILRGIAAAPIDPIRVDAAMEVFNASPGIEVVGTEEGGWNNEQAYAAMQDLLAKNPQIDAVWASDDDMALGAEKAIKEAGRSDIRFILGGAGMKDIIKRVMDNDPLYPADVTYPPGMTAAAVHLGAAHARDGDETKVADLMPPHLKVPLDQLVSEPTEDGKQRDIILPIQLITPDNAEQFHFPDSVF